MKHCTNCGWENPNEEVNCRGCGATLEQQTTRPESQLPWERIAILQNEAEAGRLKSELEAKGVPHVVISHYDSAFNGLFQTTRGWGYIEAPIEHREHILGILEDIRRGGAAPENADDRD